MFIVYILFLPFGIALALKAALALVGLRFVPPALRGAQLSWASAVSAGTLSLLVLVACVALRFALPGLGPDELTLTLWALVLVLVNGPALARLGRTAGGEPLGLAKGLAMAAVAWALLSLVGMALGLSAVLWFKAR